MPAEAAAASQIRDAATVVLVRTDGDGPRVLMGQRGRQAAFMPSKFVFPGGAVDPADHNVAPAAPLPDHLARTLGGPDLGPALLNAAIRELWEETGLPLARSGTRPPTAPPDGWRGFFAAGHAPATDRLRFFFRAITPPGRPRRFDARFFLASANDIAGDPDDFGGAEDELSHLNWLSLAEARRLDLPFITEVVLAEVEARLAAPDDRRPVPFFHHADRRSYLTALA